MKKWKIAIVAVGVLVLAGCGKQAALNEAPKGEVKKEIASKAEEKKGGVISSIKDAMGLGKTMRCEYKLKGEGADITSTTYVNGKKFKAESIVMGKKQTVIFDEMAMYSWADGEKTGMKMEKKCMEEMEKNLSKTEGGTEPTSDSISDEEFFDNATDVKCEDASNADFAIPNDITFTDQCAMLKTMMNNLPSDINIPNMPKGMPANLP
jgi:hypothetical protein